MLPRRIASLWLASSFSSPRGGSWRYDAVSTHSIVIFDPRIRCTFPVHSLRVTGPRRCHRTSYCEPEGSLQSGAEDVPQHTLSSLPLALDAQGSLDLTRRSAPKAQRSLSRATQHYDLLASGAARRLEVRPSAHLDHNIRFCHGEYARSLCRIWKSSNLARRVK